MRIGDLVVKGKGKQAGRIGVVTRIYNKNNGGHVILEVLSDGKILQWAASWCEQLEEKTE